MKTNTENLKEWYQYIALALMGAALILLIKASSPFMDQLSFILNQTSLTNTVAQAAILPVNNEPATSTLGDDQLPANASTTYRIVIPAIGVDMEVATNEPNEQKGLEVGAWHIPGTADPTNPEQWLNTVISAHRYKYTSGPKTFFHLDKLKTGDLIELYWQGKKLTYRMESSEIVSNRAVRILDKTKKPTLTLFTCNPVYSTKERLVITAVPVES